VFFITPQRGNFKRNKTFLHFRLFQKTPVVGEGIKIFDFHQIGFCSTHQYFRRNGKILKSFSTWQSEAAAGFMRENVF
jgi:hypothetical protein